MFLSPCQFQLTRHNSDEQCSAPSTLQNKTHLFTYALSKLSGEDFIFCLFNLLLYCLQNDFCDVYETHNIVRFTIHRDGLCFTQL